MESRGDAAAIASRPPSRARVWVHALRVPTLAAAVVPVLVGSAVAARDHRFQLLPALAALAGALSIQAGTNFANDFYDDRKGADARGRIGPTRVLAAGWLRPAEVRRAMVLAFALATLAGIYLVARGGWPIALVGIASIAAGIGYTAGRWALGYHGLGDVAVFVFFGFVAVTGTEYVQAGFVSALAAASAIPVGALATAILVVNNVRDLDGDRASGKRTLAVRLGRRGARFEYAALLAVAFAMPVALVLVGALAPPALLPLATFPLALRALRAVMTREDGPALNRALVATARLHALFGALFAAGILVG